MDDDADDLLDDEAVPLVGTEWRLISIEGDAVERDQDDGGPSLTFGDDGRVAGSTGVNRMTGSYEVVGAGREELHLGGMATTRMAGLPAAMALEQSFLAALGDGGPFAIDGDVLTLGILAFVAVSPEPDA